MNIGPFQISSRNHFFSVTSKRDVVCWAEYREVGAKCYLSFNGWPLLSCVMHVRGVAMVHSMFQRALMGLGGSFRRKEKDVKLGGMCMCIGVDVSGRSGGGYNINTLYSCLKLTKNK